MQEDPRNFKTGLGILGSLSSVRLLVFLMLLQCGCGRLGFEEIDGGDGGSVDSGSLDATDVDAANFDSGVPDACALCTWWDPRYLFRRRIDVVPGMVAGAENDLPVMVQLDSTRIEYAQAFGGRSLRFVASDDRTSLLHEIETWSEGGTSTVWVRLPRIEGTTPAQYFWMYYGNATATAGAMPREVWSNGFDAVWHLASLDDATGRTTGARAVGGATPSTQGLGGSYQFDGTGLIDLAVSLPVLQAVPALTLTSWFRAEPAAGERNIVSLAAEGAPSSTSRAWISVLNQREIRAGGRALAPEAPNYIETNDGAVTTSAWHHIAMVLRYAEQRIDVFVDGRARSTALLPIVFSAPLSSMQPCGVGAIGAEDNGSAGFFVGAIDELRVARVARSALWIDFDQRSVRDQLLTIGPAETLP